MKAGLIILGLALRGFLMSSAHAQGTIYLSGLNQPTSGSLAVGNDAWAATWFQTGSAPGGYVLNSIHLSLDQASGNPSGFRVMIWDFPSAQPVVTLAGPDPSGGGEFAYAATGVTLAPLKTYWFVVTAATPVVVGAYGWNYSPADPVGVERWLGGGVYMTSMNGVQWTRYPGQSPQFAVHATPIPEPGMLALGLCGGTLWLAARGWRRTGCAPKRPVPKAE